MLNFFCNALIILFDMLIEFSMLLILGMTIENSSPESLESVSLFLKQFQREPIHLTVQTVHPSPKRSREHVPSGELVINRFFNR